MGAVGKIEALYVHASFEQTGGIMRGELVAGREMCRHILE